MKFFRQGVALLDRQGKRRPLGIDGISGKFPYLFRMFRDFPSRSQLVASKDPRPNCSQELLDVRCIRREVKAVDTPIVVVLAVNRGRRQEVLLPLDFVTRIFPRLPEWIPAHTFLACVFGSLLLSAGVAIMFEKT